ncbi:MAG: peptidase dimerization domain-containing protein, partial [Verrucomicrobiota bacterium]
MDLPPYVPEILDSAKNHLESLPQLRDVVLANAVFCGEIPSPTFGEKKRIAFMSDRFTESGVESSVDEVGNVTAVVPGKDNKKNILLVAHADTLWEANDDHAVKALTDTLHGIGLADNSLGIAAMASLPLILERLGIELNANLILLGAVRSLGRGDLEGLRFFLDHTQKPVHGAVCIEGAQLGRLSHSCLGMVRGKIVVTVPKNQDWKQWGAANAITSLHQIVDQILAIGRPDKPRTQIILGSVRAGSGYNTSPERATLRFEVRSESEEVVNKIHGEINQILEEANAHRQGKAELSIIAQRTPG